MKRSNKLLLGGFLTIILIMVAIHISLFAKYRAGNYTLYNDDLAPMAMQAFPTTKFISLNNLPNVEVRFADTMKVEKVDGDQIQFSQRGDTLHVSPKDTSEENGYEEKLTIHIPTNTLLSATNSQVVFHSSPRAKKGSAAIFLNRSKLLFLSPEGHINIGALKITAANKSSVSFQNSVIDQLDVQLLNSSLRDTEGSIGLLSITTDSLSQINLQAKHLLNAKIATSSGQ